MSDADAREAAHVHWLLLGALSPTPKGRRFVLDAESFAETFKAAAITARVDIGPALGAAGAQVVELRFDQLKQYSMKHVLASLSVLAELRKLADELGGPSSRRPSDDAAIARVVAAIGDGPLAAELRKLFAGDATEAADETPRAEPSPGGEPTPTGGELVDELLSNHDAKAEAPKKAVDSFIAAIRGKPAASKGEAATPAHRRARELVETAVFGAVGAVLADPAVTEPEALWRGLHLIVKHAPKRSSMMVEVVDVEPSGLEAAIQHCLDDDPINRPDAFFCFDRIEDPTRLQALASLAEDMHAPIVFGVGPEFFAVTDPEDVIQALRDGKPDASAAMPEGWAELRADEVSRWLAVTTNDVVVATEGAGAARRTVLGSSVFVLAAMLAASFHHTGGFARILGKSGGLEAPGLREVGKGSEAGTTIPTAAFVSIRGQTEMAEQGIIALGSGRNTTLVALSAMPTVHGSRDVVPLSAQILTGRLVRFGRWVCDQIPAGSSRDEIVKLFKDAATVFLFPGLSTGAQLDAGVLDSDDGPTIRLVASVSPQLAGIPFEVGFDLPISVAIGD